jgi:hypothetical protein
VTGQPVPAGQVRRGDLLAYGGRELLVTGTYGTWYPEDGQPVAGLAIECRSGCPAAAAPPERPGPAGRKHRASRSGTG